MKMTLITFTLLLSILPMFSQDRVNAISEKFETKSSKVEQARYWQYDEPNWKSRSNKDLTGQYENFDYLRFAKLQHEEALYYVLIVQSTTGAFEYPTISAGWYTFKERNFYGYMISEYLSIVNIAQGETLVLYESANAYWSAKWGDQYSEHKIVTNIKYDIDHERKPSTFWLIKRTTSNGKDVIRFTLPEKQYSWETLEKNKEDFEKWYFEVPYSVFKTIFIK